MNKPKYRMQGRVWLYPGMAGWHFVSLTKKVSKEIKNSFGATKRGFGSIPIFITVGKTTWKTSIFPDNKSGTYLLPLKAEVRKKEDIEADQVITFSIELDV